MLSIIVPTLNEAENIPSLVTQVAAALKGKVPGWDMIIVDDDSADGTDRICGGLRRQGLPVSLVVRESEKGLATAVLEGFCRSKGEYLVVMDADLSHPPEKIPEFYRHLRRGSDFVLGSRYLPGGGTDYKWTAYRYLNSKAATFLALPLAHLTRCPDSLLYPAPPGSGAGTCLRLVTKSHWSCSSKAAPEKSPKFRYTFAPGGVEKAN